MPSARDAGRDRRGGGNPGRRDPSGRRLDPLRLRRRTAEQRPGRNGDHGGERRPAAPSDRAARRHGRLSPIYLRGVGGSDLFVVTTTYGKTEAIDADTGAVVWRYTPPAYDALAGTAQITNATPVADPSRRYLYAASPDGRITKLSLATGQALWSTPITLDPTHEKIAAALNFSGGMVVATTGGYTGDAPPYQGHIVELSASDGRVLKVWNSLCSDRTGVIQPSSCSSSDSAIWARSGAVVVPGSRQILVATGNGPWNGHTDWGDSVLLLAPALALLGTWVFVANYAGTQAWRLVKGRLRRAWQNARPGTSPVVAGGLAYIYDPNRGGLNVYVPKTGHRVATLPAGPGHWESPIATDGRIALPEGNANDHRSSGVLDIYR